MRDKVRGANGRDIEVLGIADIPIGTWWGLLLHDCYSLQYTSRWHFGTRFHA